MKTNYRNAVVTLAIGEPAKSIGELTHPTMELYAERTKSDFVAIETNAVNFEHPKFEKFQLYDLLEAYDRVFFLDNDIIVMPNCPDVFRLVPRQDFGAFFDSEDAVNNEEDIPEWRNEEILYFQDKYGDINWRNDHFNSGVMLLSKEHREIVSYKNPIHRGKRFVDQTQINYNFQKNGYSYYDLGPKFNYLLALGKSKRLFKNRFNNHILHYAGFEHFYRDESLYDRIKVDVKLMYRLESVLSA